MKLRLIFILLAMIPFTLAQAAVINVFDSRTDFLAALGGASTQTQDFSGFAAGTILAGVEILPGVTSTFTRGANSSAPQANFRADS